MNPISPVPKALAEGIFLNSRLFRAVLFSGAAVGGLYFCVATPAAWMVAAAAVGGLAVGILTQLPYGGYQRMSFEATALFRLLKGGNYNEIPVDMTHKLYLGALPNRLGEEVSGKILALNEIWERNPMGFSVPGKADKVMIAKDHVKLSLVQMDEAADWIRDELAKGDVYVHCRAGNGRSAMAIAAYLIKYHGIEPVGACSQIKAARPSSTIWKKLDRLEDFKTQCSSTDRDHAE